MFVGVNLLFKHSSVTLCIAAILGGLAVVLGAFGAHGLKGVIDPKLLVVYQTGVQYQFYHVLAMLVIALLQQNNTSEYYRWAALSFFIGTVLFSGSLYLLALGGPRWCGMITPLGGVSFILGWALLAYTVIKVNRQV